METTIAERAVRRLVVTTPEHVELRFETAGVGSRAGAQMIDGLILLVMNLALGLIAWGIYEWTGGSLPGWSEEYGAAALIIVFTLLNGAYFIVAEAVTGGRTPGKRVMGIRVIQENGRPIGFLSSAIRNFLRVIDMLPGMYLLGFLFSFFHRYDKRLGDIAAGTVVVYEAGSLRRKRKRLDKMIAIWRPRMPIVELDGWQRERVTEEDWALLSAFADQLAYLSNARSAELAKGIAELLGPRLGLELPSFGFVPAYAGYAATYGSETAAAADRRNGFAPSGTAQAGYAPPPASAPDGYAPPGTSPAGYAPYPPAGPTPAFSPLPGSQQAYRPLPRPPRSWRPPEVAWTLAVYEALRADWEIGMSAAQSGY